MDPIYRAKPGLAAGVRYRGSGRSAPVPLAQSAGRHSIELAWRQARYITSIGQALELDASDDGSVLSVSGQIANCRKDTERCGGSMA
jgi:hypothetical protein